MTILQEEKSQGGGITVTTTTTSENGGYIAEIPSSFNMDDITISVSGGVNAYTNEPSEFTAEVKPKHFGTNVTPVTKMATELVKQGEDPEFAKVRVVDFVKSLLDSNEIDGREITHDHLFERTMNDMLVSEDKKEIAIKATAFQAIETSLKMFADARSGAKLRATNAEDRKTSLTDVVKALRTINVEKGERIDIDELTDKSLKKMVENDASLVGTSIDTENSFEKLTHSLVENKETLLRSVREHSSLNLSAMEIIQKVEENRKDADIEVEMMKEVFKVDVESCAGNKECADQKVEDNFTKKMDSKEEHKSLIEKKKDEGTYVSPITFDVSKLESAKQTQIKQNQLDGVKASFDSTLRMFKNAEKQLESCSIIQLLEVKFTSARVEEAVQACIGNTPPHHIDIDHKICIVNARKGEEPFMEYLDEAGKPDVYDLFKHEEEIVKEFNDTEESTDELIETIKMEIEEEGLKFNTRSFDVVNRLRSQITGGKFCCIVAPKGKCCNTLGGNFIVGPKDPGYGDLPIDGPTIDGPIEVPELETPVKEEPVGKLVDFNDLQKSIEDIKSFGNQHFLLDVQCPTSTEEIDMFVEDAVDKATKGLKTFKETVEKGDLYSNIAEAYFVQRIFEQMRSQATEPMYRGGASEEDREIVEANYGIMSALYDFIDLHGRAYVFNSSIPSVIQKLESFQNNLNNVETQIESEKNTLKDEITRGGKITQFWRLRSIVQYIARKATYDLIFDGIQNEYMGNSNLVLNKVNDDTNYKLGFSDITVSSFDQVKGLVTLTVKGSLSDLQNNNHNYDNFVYIAEKDQCVSISEEGEKSTFVISVGSELSTNVSDVRCHLPGVVIQSSDNQSDFQNRTRTMGRVAFVGSDCNDELTLETWIIRSNSCCYQSGWNILHKSFNEYSPKLLLRSYIENANEAQGAVWGIMSRNESWSSVEEYAKANPTTPMTRTEYYMQENNSLQNHNPFRISNNSYQDICGGYELADGLYGLYKTVTNKGANQDELSNPLYVKYDIGNTNTTMVYDLVDGEYVPYTGWVYTKQTNVYYSTRDKIRASADVNHYLSINGLYQGSQLYQFGVNPQARGFMDCDGDERSNVLMVYSHYLKHNFGIDKRFIGTTVVWKSVDGVELGRQTFNESNLANPFTESVGKLLDNYSNYFVRASIGDEGEIIYQITNELRSWGFGRFGQPDATGKFSYEFTECVDTDGDGYYDQIDFDPNDPNIFGDYDLDGIVDHLDDFPFDPGTVYSICKDVESGENVAINANFSKLDEFMHSVYPTEKGGTTVRKGYEFVKTINEEPAAGTTKVLLNPSDNMRIDPFHAEGDETLLTRLSQYREKDNAKSKGKGGEEFIA